ncbi:hypothetical protein KW784_02240 [Candidatus Parcubacteria bacterium]|nr:hypothetical protein [Candidatus Parcubacteria bacterium]
MKKHRGIVIATGKKLEHNKVRIEDPYDQSNGKEFGVISTHKNITLGKDMRVEFILVSATSQEKELVMAGDVCPTHSESELADDSVIRRSYSLLHSITENVVRTASVHQNSKKKAGLGRGGPKHQYIQQVVQRLGRELGYLAIIEKRIEGTHLSIDISLEKDGFRVACEVPVHNIDGEVGNLKKCLNAGYDYAVSVATERKTLERIGRYARRRLTSQEFLCTRFFLPEELEVFLRAEGGISTEKKVNGYRVHVTYRPLRPEQSVAKRSAITQIIAEAVRRRERERIENPDNIF